MTQHQEKLELPHPRQRKKKKKKENGWAGSLSSPLGPPPKGAHSGRPLIPSFFFHKKSKRKPWKCSHTIARRLLAGSKRVALPDDAYAPQEAKSRARDKSAEILDYCASMSQRWSKQAARRGTEVGSGLLFADPKRAAVAWGVSGLPSPASPLYGQARESLSVLGLGLDFF